MPEKASDSRGIFISFEGGEGVGKTTQIRMLADFLRAQGKEVMLVREPGGTQLGEDVRKILKFSDYDNEISPQAEALLFAAARAQLVRETILPALGRGTWVLSDRFTDSSIAYQGAGRALGSGDITAINRFATGGLEPAMTILLDLPAREGFARLRSRAAENSGKSDRMEALASDFYERVRAGYLALANAAPQRFFVVAADKAPEKIAEEIRNELSKRFAGISR
ncbi:MAG: dTMP kinase [Opitutae bacterium]|nr:dTMP kinase [Opitutae bacterium]